MSRILPVTHKHIHDASARMEWPHKPWSQQPCRFLSLFPGPVFNSLSALYNCSLPSPAAERGRERERCLCTLGHVHMRNAASLLPHLCLPSLESHREPFKGSRVCEVHGAPLHLLVCIRDCFMNAVFVVYVMLWTFTMPVGYITSRAFKL